MQGVATSPLAHGRPDSELGSEMDRSPDSPGSGCSQRTGSEKIMTHVPLKVGRETWVEAAKSTKRLLADK